MLKRTLLASALIWGVAFSGGGPAMAQDIASRILSIENQIRELTGKIEELNHSVDLLQKQVANPQTSQQGALDAPATSPEAVPLNVQKKQLAADTGGEAIVDAPAEAPQQAVILGANAQTPDVEAVTQQAAVETGTGAVPQQPVVDGTTGDAIQQVSLTPPADTPESVYEKGVESLLRRKFSDAEVGFRTFLDKYPEHNLAGSAQYQLGETYYAQADFRSAAQNYLQAYKKYPKARRAPDSLLKLGMSLGKLGQKDQACAALGSVATEFPQAVEAKKRAQVESKRAGC